MAVTEGLTIPAEAKSARTDDYKYVVWMRPEQVRELGRGASPERPASRELYHLAADPEERVDLLRRPDAVDAAGRAAAIALDRELRERSAAAEGGATVVLGAEEIERLRALGYVGDG